VRKRSVTLRGHRTSVALEEEFWRALEVIAAARNRSLAGLIADIDAERADPAAPAERPLASALRVFVLKSLTGDC